MPVKYSQEFQVPKEFPDVLRNLTREILRQQPKDINKFGEYLICSPYNSHVIMKGQLLSWLMRE